MKIYEFQVSGEREWICANTAFEALQVYHATNDMQITDFSDSDDIRIVPESEWEGWKILNTDERDSEGNHPVIKTFAEYMHTATQPDMIASTCY